MKRSVKIIVGIVTVILVSYLVIFVVDYMRCSNLKMPIFVCQRENTNTYYGLGYTVELEKYDDSISKVEMYMFNRFITGAIADTEQIQEELIEDDEVNIKNGSIKNRNLIDEFINLNNEHIKEERTLKIICDDEIILLRCIPGEYDRLNNNLQNAVVESQTISTAEEYQNYYGYYELEKAGVIEEFDRARWQIKRKIENNKVILYFSTYMELTECPIICQYNIEGSGYEQSFELNYVQEKHMGIEEIAKIDEFDNKDFGVYTFGGDATITIENDMVYDLKDALRQNIITTNDILEYVKLDQKYGICEVQVYYDGGSIEYIYPDYTVLKYNTLDGNKDLIIGMKGQIINNVNKIDYK